MNVWQAGYPSTERRFCSYFGVNKLAENGHKAFHRISETRESSSLVLFAIGCRMLKDFVLADVINVLTIPICN